jgi:IS5 family transposase
MLQWRPEFVMSNFMRGVSFKVVKKKHYPPKVADNESSSTANLSDPAVEDALYDSLTMRALVGIDLGREPVPDEITVCKFRHLLERHGLGKQWHFGMKAHVGVDAGTKLIHSATATAANVADSRVLPELLHGEETEVWGDQACQGQTEVIRQRAPKAEDRIHRRYRTRRICYPEIRKENHEKSRTCSRIEHVFALIKLRFGFTKIRY